MDRLSVACRDYVPGFPCSVSFYAENLEDLLEAAIEHVRAAHYEEDTPALRGEIRAKTRLEGAQKLGRIAIAEDQRRLNANDVAEPAAFAD